MKRNLTLFILLFGACTQSSSSVSRWNPSDLPQLAAPFARPSHTNECQWECDQTSSVEPQLHATLESLPKHCNKISLRHCDSPTPLVVTGKFDDTEFVFEDVSLRSLRFHDVVAQGISITDAALESLEVSNVRLDHSFHVGTAEEPEYALSFGTDFDRFLRIAHCSTAPEHGYRGGVLVTGDVTIEEFAASTLKLVGARFEQRVTAKHMAITQSVFTTSSEFYGPVNMQGLRARNLEANGSRFHDDVRLLSAQVEDNVNFSCAFVGGSLDMETSTVGKVIQLSMGVFGDDLKNMSNENRESGAAVNLAGTTSAAVILTGVTVSSAALSVQGAHTQSATFDSAQVAGLNLEQFHAGVADFTNLEFLMPTMPRLSCFGRSDRVATTCAAGISIGETHHALGPSAVSAIFVDAAGGEEFLFQYQTQLRSVGRVSEANEAYLRAREAQLAEPGSVPSRMWRRLMYWVGYGRRSLLVYFLVAGLVVLGGSMFIITPNWNSSARSRLRLVFVGIAVSLDLFLPGLVDLGLKEDDQLKLLWRPWRSVFLVEQVFGWMWASLVVFAVSLYF